MHEKGKADCKVELDREENRGEEVSKMLSSTFNSPLMPEESAGTTAFSELH